MRDEYNRPRCPKCGAVLKQVEKADYCDNCDYEEKYP